jgi:hypothetical protein
MVVVSPMPARAAGRSAHMFRTLAGVALAGTLLAAPALAQNGKTEFGVDVGIAYTKYSGASNGVFAIHTPVDVRIAFPLAGNLALEPRFSATFVSSSGDSYHLLNPGLNLLIGLPGGAYNKGLYVTAGGALAIMGGTGTTSESAFSLNAGLGMRSPMGAGASRGELFVGYTPKQGTAVPASILTLGVRLGLSFFN